MTDNRRYRDVSPSGMCPLVAAMYAVKTAGAGFQQRLSCTLESKGENEDLLGFLLSNERVMMN